MNTTRTLSAAAALLAAVTFSFVSSGLAQMDHGKMGEMSAASTAYMDAMTKMDAEMDAMTMTGKPGADFALMMIPHHQSAIDMARAYLASGENDPELTRLSNDIIVAQETEIAFLKDWLKKNGQ
ncbi:MAG: DUF305 domain-containing protein [Mesorhizobium sp.]|nr:DUF305 domain-containing protein [Mesorhizobium sp.]